MVKVMEIGHRLSIWISLKKIKIANYHPKSHSIFTTKLSMITFIFWNSLALSKVKKKVTVVSRAFFKKLGVTAESTKNEYSNHRINSTKELKMSSNSPDPPVPRGPRGPPYTMYLSSYDGKSDGNRPFKFLWKIIKSANCHLKVLAFLPLN